MTRPLYLAYLLMGYSLSCYAQCAYPVNLHTNKDYCVGSSLIVGTTHALQKIVWYKNGTPVSMATGTQSLDTAGVFDQVLAGPQSQFSTFSDIASDGAGNIYLAYQGRVLRYIPGGADAVTVVDYPPFVGELGKLSVDEQGDIYELSVNSWYGDQDSALVMVFAAGTGDSSTLVYKRQAYQAIGQPVVAAGAFYVDCQKNIYALYPYNEAGGVYKFSPGSNPGVLVAPIKYPNNQCNYGYVLPSVQVDNQGNIFYSAVEGIKEMKPGAAAPINAAGGNCGDPNHVVTGFWIDANDTIYEAGWNRTTGALFVDKWAPGASFATSLGSHPVNFTGGDIVITMDVKGNIFLAWDQSNSILEFKRHTSIDSAYAPSDTGVYYAVVTDIRGYTTVSDSIRINTPSGPPSIQISATATSTPVCTPITFTANVLNPGFQPSYHWMVSGVPAGGDTTVYSYNLFANGDQVYCILNTEAGCEGPVADTSNVIQLAIDPHGAASITIATPKDTVCQGDSVLFTATVVNGSAQPVFEWLLNGVNTGAAGPSYGSDHFVSGDIVTCLITSDDVCGLAKSNSIPIKVSIRPKVDGGQLYTILRGQSVTLKPGISGDVSSYAWTPVTALSDPTVANPDANPVTNTLYTLTATAAGGCSDTGSVFVNVYTPISLPGGFTPNGDGHNDVFYVLGGPVNSTVEEMAVYNRNGAEVFVAHDAVPGDRRYGWDGTMNGSQAPMGTYVYVIEMRFADGSRQLYKGTVVLIR